MTYTSPKYSWASMDPTPSATDHSSSRAARTTDSDRWRSRPPGPRRSLSTRRSSASTRPFPLSANLSWTGVVPIFTDIRERTPEEVDKLRVKQEGERAEHYRWVYELLGLRVVARRDEALVASGTFGTRKRASGEP